MLQLKVLPARQGDAIWIRWGETDLRHQMLVDMGTESVGRALRETVASLPLDQRKFELLVITHIDSDHIGGAISCLVNEPPLDGLDFCDVWFNGLDHLKPKGPSPLEEHGAVQGRELMKWLGQRKWNHAFGESPVLRDGKPRKIELKGGLTIQVLGPTRERLAALAPVWATELAAALAKRIDPSASGGGVLEKMGRQKPTRPGLSDAASLRRLAATASGGDPSRPNGSSIVLLLEHGTSRVLLAADAYAGDLVDGLRSLEEGLPVRLDAFKLPHHGSKSNVTSALIDSVDCHEFIVSTDGTQFYHPDAEAIACVVSGSRQRPARLRFNVRAEFSSWWDDAAWRAAFDYETSFGEDAGLVLNYPR